MVRSGGRSRVIHSVAMKSTKRSIAVPLQAMAMLLRSRLRSAVTAEVSDSTKTAAATHGNMFHPNSILLYLFAAWRGPRMKSITAPISNITMPANDSHCHGSRTISTMQ